MGKKQAIRRQPVPKNTRSRAASQSDSDDVVATGRGGKGKGKPVVPDEEDDEEPALAQPKQAAKKVTFKIGTSNSRGKGKGKAAAEAEPEEEEDGDDESAEDEDDPAEEEEDGGEGDEDPIEEEELDEGDVSAEEEDGGDDREESDVASDHVDAAVETAVNLGRAPPQKKRKPKEVTKGLTLAPAALTMENGESSKRRKRSDNTIVVRKTQVRLDAKKKEVNGHGSPRQLFNLISILTEEQKKDVENIGFGGLLELKTNAFYHQMADWLLRKYDPSSRMFIFNRHYQFPLTKHDVYDAFMLPCTDLDIDTKTDQDLAQLWRVKFKVPPNSKLSLESLRLAMVGLPAGGAEFQKMFVLYAMGTFLAPTVHNHVDFRLVKAVKDAGAIARLDWCSLVLLRLGQAVSSWRTHGTKNVGGCLLFLQLMYFHRLTWWGEPEKTMLPLVQHWTYEHLRKRMAAEVAAYPYHQGFGLGVWELDTYPISRHQVKRLYRRPPPGTPTSRAPPTRFVTLPLPDGVRTDEELHTTFDDIMVRHWMTTKRNLSVVSHMHKSLTEELQIIEEAQTSERTSGGGGGGQSQGSFTQEMNNPEWLAAWNTLGDSVDALVMVQPPSFSLGIDDLIPPSQIATHTRRNTRSKKGTSQRK